MDRLIELLNSKNHFLERFFLMNEVELINFEKGDFKHLGLFYNTRDKILQTIGEIDKKIEESVDQLSDQELATESMQKKVSQLINEKESLVNQILDQDLRVLSLVEKEKSEIIKELRKVNKSRRALRGYHSEGSQKYLSNG